MTLTWVVTHHVLCLYLAPHACLCCRILQSLQRLCDSIYTKQSLKTGKVGTRDRKTKLCFYFFLIYLVLLDSDIILNICYLNQSQYLPFWYPIFYCCCHSFVVLFCVHVFVLRQCLTMYLQLSWNAQCRSIKPLERCVVGKSARLPIILKKEIGGLVVQRS